MKNDLELSIITVTYNSEKFIRDYLTSVSKYLPKRSEIIIIDNNSQDKTVKIIKKTQGINLIQSKENLGFGKACNKGVTAAKGKYLLFLNPDTKVTDDSIKRLLEYIKADKEVGIIAPKLIEPNGEIQESVKKSPSLIGAIKEYIFGIRNSYKQFAPIGDASIEVDAVYGAAIMISKELFLKVKGFDERYFLYYEDLDLCRKVKDLGLKIIYYSESSFIHQVGASAKHIKTTNLPFIIRTLANFIPMKASGGVYYQMQSGNIYHGVLTAFLIRLVIYIGTKIR